MHLTIGQFSRATGLTVTALRHYDELGVLRPATVDPSTGYRGYDPGQVEHGQLVRLARRAGVALLEAYDAVAGWLIEHRFALDGPAYEQAVSWSGEPGHPDNRLAVGFALR